MTAYLMTEAQHAQIVDALQDGIKWLNICDKPRECIPLHEALAMLKAMKPVEPCAFRNPVDSYSLVTVHQKETNEFQYSDEFLAAHTEPLYALGDTA